MSGSIITPDACAESLFAVAPGEAYYVIANVVFGREHELSALSELLGSWFADAYRLWSPAERLLFKQAAIARLIRRETMLEVPSAGASSGSRRLALQQDLDPVLDRLLAAPVGVYSTERKD